MEILTSLLLSLAIASCADEAAAGSIQHDRPDFFHKLSIGIICFSK